MYLRPKRTRTIDLKPNQVPRFGEIRKTLPHNTSDYASFVCKLDSNGKVLWTQWTGSGVASGSLKEHAVVATPDGDVIIGGTFLEHSIIGDENQAILLYPENPDTKRVRGFVARFGGNGILHWGRTIDADVVSKINGVETDPEGFQRQLLDR